MYFNETSNAYGNIIIEDEDKIPVCVKFLSDYTGYTFKTGNYMVVRVLANSLTADPVVHTACAGVIYYLDAA